MALVLPLRLLSCSNVSPQTRRPEPQQRFSVMQFGNNTTESPPINTVKIGRGTLNCRALVIKSWHFVESSKIEPFQPEYSGRNIFLRHLVLVLYY